MILLHPEERFLAVLRWIQMAIPLERTAGSGLSALFLGQIADRVGAFGGDPTHVLPDPTGTRPGGHDHPHRDRDHHHIPCLEHGVRVTGKITGLIYDRFGDFDGFLLDTEDGERAFRSREHEMEDLAKLAWTQRIMVTVLAEHRHSCELISLILRGHPGHFNIESRVCEQSWGEPCSTHRLARRVRTANPPAGCRPR